MPLFDQSQDQPTKKDWMDIALEFERQANGDWNRAAQMAVVARDAEGWKDEDLAAAEHFLFSRSFSAQSPLNAASIAAGTPAYYGMKKANDTANGSPIGAAVMSAVSPAYLMRNIMSPGGDATPASFNQVKAGLGGALMGLMGK